MSNMRAALVQMCATRDKDRNRQTVADLCRQAADGGAQLTCLPELWSYWIHKAHYHEQAEPLDGPTAEFLSDLARQTGMWLVGGSFLEVDPATRQYFNTSLLVDRDGRHVTHYRKLHLFDINLVGRHVSRESDIFTPGDRIVAAETPWGILGMTICYDLRFPELYRSLSASGANLLAIPSAFTAATGPAHWQTLLQARAIENQAFVLAANQCGTHADNRRSHGHSMILDPWGRVLCSLQEEPGVAVAELDFDEQARIRRELPCLDHRRIGTGELPPSTEAP